MSKNRKVSLTEREADEVRTLLNVVLTNHDQWETWDLAALRRVSRKLEEES